MLSRTAFRVLRGTSRRPQLASCRQLSTFWPGPRKDEQPPTVWLKGATTGNIMGSEIKIPTLIRKRVFKEESVVFATIVKMSPNGQPSEHNELTHVDESGVKGTTEHRQEENKPKAKQVMQGEPWQWSSWITMDKFEDGSRCDSVTTFSDNGMHATKTYSDENGNELFKLEDNFEMVTEEQYIDERARIIGKTPQQEAEELAKLRDENVAADINEDVTKNRKAE